MITKYFFAIPAIIVLIIIYYNMTPQINQNRPSNIVNGETIFKENCLKCHDSSTLNSTAPILKNKKEWVVLYESKQKAIDLTINGNSKMPARGYCLKCTDQDLIDALDYVIDFQNSKQN